MRKEKSLSRPSYHKATFQAMNCNSWLEELGCPHPDSLTRSPAGHQIEPGLDNLRRHLSMQRWTNRQKNTKEALKLAKDLKREHGKEMYQAPKPSAAAKLAGN